MDLHMHYVGRSIEKPLLCEKMLGAFSSTNCIDSVTCPECRVRLGLPAEKERWLCPICQHVNDTDGEFSRMGYCQNPECAHRNKGGLPQILFATYTGAVA